MEKGQLQIDWFGETKVMVACDSSLSCNIIIAFESNWH